MVDIEQIIDEFYSLLPIKDDEVAQYVSSVFPSIQNSNNNEQYQFSYFGVHLIFMTYVYCIVWQISKLSQNRFMDTAVFARTYNGCEEKLKFHDIKSVFNLSHMPETDIINFLCLLNVDASDIGQARKLVKYRNEMAHANGKIQIASLNEFETAIKEIQSIIKCIEKKMELYIKEYYGNVLRVFLLENEYGDYNNWDDIVNEHLVVELSFSKRQLEYCTNFGLTRIKNNIEPRLTREQIIALNELHTSTVEYYTEIIEA